MFKSRMEPRSEEAWIMAADQISGFSLLVAPFVRARANCLTTPAALQHFVTPGNRLLQEKWLAQSFTEEGYSSFIRCFSDKRLVVSTSSLVFIADRCGICSICSPNASNAG
ncbi:hypothetical protein, partial [Caballeronia arationis]|uniref:hypothetical protein n=1 Tax=Caballeronia arationis TaxID=1777142 RepID=UPI001F2D2C86